MTDISDEGKNSLIHFHEYGYKNDQPVNKVIPSERWLESKINKPQTQAWNQEIPKDEVPKLLLGYRATCMEEKWNIYTEDEDKDGLYAIHMLRSWTSRTMIIARFSDKEGNARFVDITWESENDWTYEDAVETATKLCSWVLHVKLPE